MTDTTSAQADALLLTLNDHEFIDIGAILGLRARPSQAEDLRLIEAFLDSDIALCGARRKMVLAFLPDLPPQ